MIDESITSELGLEKSAVLRSSRYDLPIEFHMESIPHSEKRRTTSFSRMSGIADKPVIKWQERESEPKRRSKFEYLLPNIIPTRLDEQQRFGFVRDIALTMIECDIISQLTIMYDKHICNSRELTESEIPYRMFSWSMADFLERRKLHNMIWVEVLLMDLGSFCLEVHKFKIDMEELMNLLKLIFRGVSGENRIFDMNTNVFEIIEEMSNFLRIYENLTEELEQNRAIFRNDVNELLTLRFNSVDPAQREKRTILDDKLMNFHVWSPIEMRYQLRYQKNTIKQKEHKAVSMENNIQQEITTAASNKSAETYCAQCTMNMYYSLVENYKQKIEEYTLHYDSENEALDNQIISKKMALEKLRTSRKFMLEEIQRFHEEIQQLQVKELEQKLREEIEREQSETAALARKSKRLEKKLKKIKKINK